MHKMERIATNFIAIPLVEVELNARKEFISNYEFSFKKSLLYASEFQLVSIWRFCKLFGIMRSKKFLIKTCSNNKKIIRNRIKK